ncbi:hypothetical protein PC110_g21339 [Phytophthora cactorum]|uniref:Peptidase A2 domain-containing protein n=2 Tax=Phytophthora cactorum TaxID=29920 RepID=A0A329RCW5_9STRA|nr:hypothetical protein PC119_g23494 [Phytophthora cactorum]KAG3053258.1 hypothetical protein PC122_g22397 [Phytophthora cactorum]RAW22221.1 hypothetical protein PC110_g21339 [Phytophthora cactorum]
MPRTRLSESAGADSDDERTTAPIFTPVLPPRLTSTSHAALVKWRGERHLEQEKVYQTLKRAKRHRGDRDSGRTPTRVPPKPPTKKPRVVEASKRGLRPAVKLEKERPKVPPTPCPHCKGMLWLSECSTTTDDQKAEIRRKLRAQRAERNSKVFARLKRLRECLSPQEKTVTLNDVLSIPYCADTGADRTALSRQHVQDLQKLDSSVVVQALPTPIINSTVGDGEIECSASAQLRLLLNTAGGPVALNDPIECLIIEDREPEFILGQDVLLSLGIDVDRQLEQLAVRTEDEDGGEDDLNDDLDDLRPPNTDDELQRL